MEAKITIELTKDEGLVLFEFLSRFNGKSHHDIFEDQAEQKALWLVEGQLQEILSEPFLPNYMDIIKQARDKIRDNNE